MATSVGRAVIDIDAEAGDFVSDMSRIGLRGGEALESGIEKGARGTNVRFGKLMSGLENSASKGFGAVSRIGQIAFGNIVAKATQAITYGTAALIKMGLDTLGTIQLAEQSLKAFGYAGEEVARVMDRLKTVARRSPFEFPELVETTRRLYGVSEAIFGTGLSLKQTEDNVFDLINTIGNLTATFGGTQANFDNAVLAVSQMGAQGKIAAQEMRQLNDALPGFNAWRELAAGIGISEAELREMSKEGQLLSSKYLPILLQRMKDFGPAAGAMDRASRTITGTLSNLKDTVSLALADALVPFAEVLFTMFNVDTGTMVGPLTDALTSFGEAAAAALEALAPLFPLLLEGFGKVMGLIAQLATAIAPHIPTLIELGQSIRQEFIDRVKQWGDAFSDFWEDIEPIRSALGDFVNGPLADLLGWAQEHGIVDAAATALVDLGLAMAAMKLAFTGAGFIVGILADLKLALWGMSEASIAAKGLEGFAAIVARFGIIGTPVRVFISLLEWLGGALLGLVYPMYAFLAPILVAIGPILLIVGAIAAFIAALALLYFHVKPLRDFMDSIFTDKLSTIIGVLIALVSGLGFVFFVLYKKVKPVRDAVDWLWQSLQTLWDLILGFVSSVGETLGGIFDGVEEAWQSVWDTIQGAWETIGDVWSGAWDGVTTVIENIVDLISDTWEQWSDEIGGIIQGVVDIVTGLFNRWWQFINGWITIFRGTWNALWRFWEFVWQNMVDFVGPILSGFVEFVSFVFRQVRQAIELAMAFIGPIIDAAFQVIEAIVRPILEWLVSFVTDSMDLVITGFSTFIDWIGPVWDAIWEAVQTAVEYAINFVQDIVEGVLHVIEGVVNLVAGVIDGDWQRVWDSVLSIVEGTWQVLETVLDTIIDFFETTWDTLTTIISAPFEAAWNAIKGVWDTVSNWFKNNVVNPVTNLWNSIARTWNNFRIPGITIKFSTPDVPGTDWGGQDINFSIGPWDLPDLPTFGAGGFIRGPTIGLLGESGPEVVIPLSKPQRAQQLLEQAGLSGTSTSGAVVAINSATFVQPTDLDLLFQKAEAAMVLQGAI